MALPQAVSSVGFKTLLVATDLSAHSKAAVMCAAGMARASGAQLVVAHVMNPEGWHVVSPDALHPALCHERRAVEKKLSNILKARELAGLQTDTVIKKGDFRETLCNIAHDRKADLLVLATHGRKGLAKLLFGSKVEEVCHRAPCPLVLIGPHAAKGERSRFERILFVTDMSALSFAALPLVLAFAAQHGSRLRITRVLPKERDASATNTDFLLAQTRSELLPAVTSRSGLLNEPEFHLAFGEEKAEILRDAEAWKADLIGIGATRPSAFSVYLSGNMAYDVACDARCPVMTIVD